ncbi:thiamine diphosphokinase [Acholeplasma hippikon]|uniref:Thiamine diphosphokinase n=1 Tax=Acholeplasma hippikon TaxID=264636 RepID=A0A449BK58_9MOLU|nr:thiamine diphosphokinase [Acholeplasma hippikon]VEU82834.1 Thiamine pyrophosphokinase [Acholeplasma hippikon]
MKIFIVTYPFVKNLKELINEYKPNYLIAVDSAVSFVYGENIPIDLAVGDFDTLKDKGILKTLNTIELNVMKDETDTEYAILEALKLKPDEIYLIGGIGGARIEHTYANLNYVKRYKKIKLITDESVISSYGIGTYEFNSNGYFSVFANTDSVISLKDFLYELDCYKLDQLSTIGISNEVKEKPAKLIVHAGEVLVIETKKDK